MDENKREIDDQPSSSKSGGPLAAGHGENMDSITFRDALESDLPSIIAMLADDHLGSQREIFSSPLDERYLSAFAAIQADPNQRLIAVIKDENVVGTLQLSFMPGIQRLGSWRAQIEGVRISSSLRGTGVGKQMLNYAVAECKARGCVLVQLAADKSRTDAHRFYKRFGFVASHEGFKLALDH